MKWKPLLITLGVSGIVLVVVCVRYRDALDIALSVPRKVHYPWVEEIPAKCSDMEYNEKLFKAFHVFRSGKGKYGFKQRTYDYDGTVQDILWLLVEDGKAESGVYCYCANPRPDRRTMSKHSATAMTIGYFPTPPGKSRSEGYEIDPNTWVDDEHGLAVTNERYMIQFTAPERRGGF